MTQDDLLYRLRPRSFAVAAELAGCGRPAVPWGSIPLEAAAGPPRPRGPAAGAADGPRLEAGAGNERQRQEFRSATFQATVATLGARPTFIRAGRPQAMRVDCGCVERVQQTILDECWKPASARYLDPEQAGRRLDPECYLRYYNTQRTHTGRWSKGRTPAEVLGKAKLWHKKR